MKLQNWAPVIIGLFMLAAPVLAMAQVNGGGFSGVNGGGTNSINGGGTNSVNGGGGCGASSSGFTLCNPLNVGTFCQLLKNIFNDILILGIPIATLFIVWAGFKMVFARGNEEQLRTAKRNLWYIVIGIALFLGAWTLSQIIANTLSALGGGGGLC